MAAATWARTFHGHRYIKRGGCKGGTLGREELGVVRDLGALSLANGDAACDTEESILTVGEAERGGVVTGEGGSVHMPDIDESRAGKVGG